MVFKVPDKKVTRLLGSFLRETDQEKREALAITMRDHLGKLYDNEVKKTDVGWAYYVCCIASTRLFRDSNKLTDRIWVCWRFSKCYARMLQYI